MLQNLPVALQVSAAERVWIEAVGSHPALPLAMTLGSHLTSVSLRFLIYKMQTIIPHRVIVRIEQD